MLEIDHFSCDKHSLLYNFMGVLHVPFQAVADGGAPLACEVDGKFELSGLVIFNPSCAKVMIFVHFI